MPWGIGAAIARSDSRIDEPAIFFACRTREDRRYWRMVSASGEILLRDDLPMLQFIDPDGQEHAPVPGSLDLDGLFAVATADICELHNEPPPSQSLPPSQRWALTEILGAPDAPVGDKFNQAADVFAMPQTARVKRALSALRREHSEGGMSVRKCASRIVRLVEELRLTAVPRLRPRHRSSPTILVWSATRSSSLHEKRCLNYSYCLSERLTNTWRSERDRASPRTAQNRPVPAWRLRSPPPISKRISVFRIDDVRFRAG